MKFVTKLRQIMEVLFIIQFRNCNQPICFSNDHQHMHLIYQEQHFHVVLDEDEKHGLLLGRKYMYENSNQIYIWTQEEECKHPTIL